MERPFCDICKNHPALYIAMQNNQQLLICEYESGFPVKKAMYVAISKEGKLAVKRTWEELARNASFNAKRSIDRKALGDHARRLGANIRALEIESMRTPGTRDQEISALKDQLRALGEKRVAKRMQQQKETQKDLNQFLDVLDSAIQSLKHAEEYKIATFTDNEIFNLLKDALERGEELTLEGILRMVKGTFHRVDDLDLAKDIQEWGVFDALLRVYNCIVRKDYAALNEADIKLIPKDPSFISEQQKRSLGKYLEDHKTNPECQEIVMKLIRVLIKTDFCFVGKDFSGCCFSGADFSKGRFPHCKFVAAELSGVDFTEAVLICADFTEATMNGVIFGQRPGITENSRISCAAVHPESHSLITGLEGGVVNRRDLATGHIVSTLAFKRGKILQVALFNDILLVLDKTERVSIHRLSDNTLIAEECYSGKGPSCLSINQTKWAIGFKARNILIFDIDSIPDYQHDLEIHESPVTAVLLTDGAIISGNQAGEISYLERNQLRMGRSTQPSEKCEVFRVPITLLQQILKEENEGRGLILASSKFDSAIKLLYPAQSLHVITQIETSHQSPVSSISMFNDYFLLSGSADCTVSVWELDRVSLRNPALIKRLDHCQDIEVNPHIQFRHTLRQHFRGHTGEVTFVSYDEALNEVISTDTKGFVKFWTFLDNSPPPISTILCAAIAPNQKTVATGNSKGEISLWDFKTGSLKRVLPYHTSQVNCILADAERSCFISGGNDKTICIFNAKAPSEGKLIKKVDENSSFAVKGNVLALATSSKHLISVGTNQERTIRSFTEELDKFIELPESETGTITAMAISKTGAFIAVAGQNRKIDIWTPNSQPIRTFTGHDTTVWGLKFKKINGALTLYSASEDGKVRLWEVDGDNQESYRVNDRLMAIDICGEKLLVAGYGGLSLRALANGRILAKCTMNSRPVTSAVFSKDGHCAVYTSMNSTVKMTKINEAQEFEFMWSSGGGLNMGRCTFYRVKTSTENIELMIQLSEFQY